MKGKHFWSHVIKHNGTPHTKITAEYRQFEVVGTEVASNYQKGWNYLGYDKSLLPFVFIFRVPQNTY
jgi:hypothetical protein